MRFERRRFVWRMYDPQMMLEAKRRSSHIDLQTMLRFNLLRAACKGRARGPNKHGRRFHPLCTDVLDARRQGVPGRILRGAA